MARFNQDDFIAFPKQMVAATLQDGVEPDDVVAALIAAGVADGDIGFLSGEKGLDILNPEGDHGSVKERMLRKAEGFSAEGRILERSAQALRDGKTILGITNVDDDLSKRILAIADDAGLEDCHYFGRWKID